MEAEVLTIKPARLIPIAILIVATCVPFWQVRSLDYLMWDDDVNVYENPHFLEGPLKNIGFFWTNGYEDLWIPLTYSVWAVLAEWVELPGGQVHTDTANLLETPFPPRLFHLANLGMHFCAVLLVLGILRSALGDRGRWAAVFGAAVFAAHPLQVEAVAWVTGMKDLLAGTLSMGAIWAYLRSLPQGEPGSVESGRRNARCYGVATVFFIGALLAKPATVVLPGIVFILEVLLRGRPWKGALLAATPWVALAMAATAVTWLVQSGGQFKFLPPPWWQRPVIALDAVYFYLSKAVLPIRLGPEYGRSPSWLEGQWFYYATWLVPVIAGAVGWWLWRKRRAPVYLAGFLVFVLALLPVLGLIPFAYQGISTVADRYAYLAMLGFVLALAALVSPLSRKHWRLAAAALVMVLAILSARQVRFWQDTDSVFARVLEINPRSWLIHYNLGVIATGRERWDEVLAHYSKSVELWPGYPDGHNNLGREYRRRKNPERAEYHYRMALASEPGHEAALINICALLAQQGRHQEAIHIAKDCYDRISYVRTARTLAVALSRYGAHFFNQKDYVSAMVQFENSLQFNDTEETREVLARTYNNVGVMQTQIGERNKGIDFFVKAVETHPDNREAPKNLGLTLVEAGRAAEAVEVFRKFEDRYRDVPDFLFPFAVGLAEAGRKEESAAMARRALEALDAWPTADPAYRKKILDWQRENTGATGVPETPAPPEGGAGAD